MGHLCFGSGGTIIPSDFVPGADIPDLYLDWSKEYPGSKPPPVGAVPTGDPPRMDDRPLPGTDVDAWARPIIASALFEASGIVPTQAAVQAVQAISRMESGYGWPFLTSGGVSARTGRDGRNWWGHHNWGASLCYLQAGGEVISCYDNGGCISGFYDLGRAIESGSWIQFPACFAHWDTNEAGALGFVRRLLGSDPPRVMSLLNTGDLSLVAMDLRIRQILVRTRDADQAGAYADAAWYAARILANARQIARLYDGGLQVRAGSLGAVRDVTDQGQEPPGLSDAPLEASSGVARDVAGLLVVVGIGGAVGLLWRRMRRTRG